MLTQNAVDKPTINVSLRINEVFCKDCGYGSQLKNPSAEQLAAYQRAHRTHSQNSGPAIVYIGELEEPTEYARSTAEMIVYLANSAHKPV